MLAEHWATENRKQGLIEMEGIVKHLNDSLAWGKSLCSMRGSCGDDSGNCGTFGDQYVMWERKSCEIEINGHITAIVWGRQTRI